MYRLDMKRLANKAESLPSGSTWKVSVEDDGEVFIDFFAPSDYRHAEPVLVERIEFDEFRASLF